MRRPFWRYYGGKFRIARRYPVPGPRIIEPFAGAAGYSTRYPDRDVTLYDIDENVLAMWERLIGTSEREIASLPDDPRAAGVIGSWWMNGGAASPRSNPTKWMASLWPKARDDIAKQVQYIRHWKVVKASWHTIPDTDATWFVDPPYRVGGKYYRHRDVDYAALAAWCRSRTGQVIVCEGEGHGDWLPFTPLVEHEGARHRKMEYVWITDSSSSATRATTPIACIPAT